MAFLQDVFHFFLTRTLSGNSYMYQPKIFSLVKAAEWDEIIRTTTWK